MPITKRTARASDKVSRKKRRRKPDFEIQWHPSGAVKVTLLPSRAEWSVIASHLVPDYLCQLREKMAVCQEDAIRASLQDVIDTIEAYRQTSMPVYTPDGGVTYVAGSA